MSSCKTCANQTSLIETQSEITQKRIQNQVRVSSSMYTMTFAALNSKINNDNVGKKHDSYQRRLNKLKEKVMNCSTTNAQTPLKGNKTRSYNIKSCNNVTETVTETVEESNEESAPVESTEEDPFANPPPLPPPS